MQIFSARVRKKNCNPIKFLELPGYEQYWNSAVKKGYSGTAVFTRIKPLSVTNGIGIEEHDQEGRVITAEYDNSLGMLLYTE